MLIVDRRNGLKNYKCITIIMHTKEIKGLTKLYTSYIIL